jgi:hypothetical protein
VQFKVSAGGFCCEALSSVGALTVAFSVSSQPEHRKEMRKVTMRFERFIKDSELGLEAGVYRRLKSGKIALYR